jgi:signal transduction histidine kinase
LDVKGEVQPGKTGGARWSQLLVGESGLGSELTRAVLDALPVGLYVATARAKVAYCNSLGSTLLGGAVKPGLRLESFSKRHAIYRTGTAELYPAAQLPLVVALGGQPCDAEDLERRAPVPQRLSMRATPLRDPSGRLQGVVATLQPLATALPAAASPPPAAAAPERSASEERLARNLEAIGQLAAGVAHEINTPMQYIGDNTAFLGATIRRLLDLAGSYERLLGTCRNGQPLGESDLIAYENELNKARLAFLREQAPAAIEQALGGVDQVRTIVQALKEFSHPGEDEPVLVDINHLARMASTVTRNAWRYVAALTLDLCDDPRPVRGYPQELGQVLINLIVNASHAVEERRVGQNEMLLGKIVLSTRSVAEGVEICVEDDGAGIPEAIRDRIMNPFFTTKPAGKGTGQGLPLAKSVIEERHRGRLSFESQVGVGTTFRVTLPSSRED